LSCALQYNLRLAAWFLFDAFSPYFGGCNPGELSHSLVCEAVSA
jgi:hypothetical protein